MHRIGNLALAACISTTLAAVPVGLDLKDPSKLTTASAFAKEGNNGGGNGGNGGGKGGGSDKSGGSDKGRGGDKSSSKNTNRGKSETAHARADTKEKKDPIARALGKLFGNEDAKGKTKVASVEKSKPSKKVTSPVTTTAKLKQAPKEKPLSAKLGSLNSLKRNYHAYMNAQDPRMAAIRAYVMAYAQFELENGIDAVPVDPALSDEALSAALLSAANKKIDTALPGEPAVVDPEVMGWAKDVLGVGPSVGKIDQVREELASQQPADVVDQPTEPDPEQPTDVVDQPAEPDPEQPTDVVDQPVDPEPEQPTDVVTEQPTEPGVKQPTDVATGLAGETEQAAVAE